MLNRPRLFDAFRTGGSRVLITVAAESEWHAIGEGLPAPALSPPRLWEPIELAEGTDAMLTGVSKSCAAGAVAGALDPDRHRLVISLGIAGALPSPEGLLPAGVLVAGTRSVLADEGVRTPAGWESMTEMGFPLIDGGEAVEADPEALSRAAELADAVGPIATVSVCSGSDEAAACIARRTGALAEAMEGAAAGLVARRYGVAFIELRVISNATGDRDRQQWDLGKALGRLREIAACL